MLKRLRPYFRYIRPVRWQFIGALAAGLIFGVSGGLGAPILAKNILEKAGEGELGAGELIFLALLIPVAVLLRNVAGFINSYGGAYCGQRVLEGLRTDVFRHVQLLSLSFFGKRRSGDLLSRLVTDTEVIRSGIINVSNDVIKQPATLLAGFGYIIWESFQSTEFVVLLALMGSIPLVVFPIRWAVKRLKNRAKTLQAQVGDLSAYVTENLQAPREIRAFNLQEQQVSGLKRRVRGLMKWQLKVLKYERSVAPLIEVVCSVGVAGVIIYAGRAELDVEVVGPLLIVLFMCYEPVKKLGALSARLKTMEASLDRLEEISLEKPEVMDPEKPEEFGEVRGDVSFEDVTFAYEEEQVLKGVTLEVKPGEVIGVVGPSGAGKTTFINLILRFYDPTSGVVRVDGHDLRNLRQKDLREAIAFVPQEPLLFNATAKENILVGRPGASDEEVYEAARQARAHDFISAMEAGYETMMGEKGTRLSGGQRQRLALARAFLRKAPILVLDEAASALDSENEALVQQALELLTKDKTVFIIAHRFSTLSIVNRILVFQGGVVIGDGTHEELEKSCPLYTELRDRQKFG